MHSARLLGTDPFPYYSEAAPQASRVQVCCRRLEQIYKLKRQHGVWSVCARLHTQRIVQEVPRENTSRHHSATRQTVSLLCPTFLFGCAHTSETMSKAGVDEVACARRTYNARSSSLRHPRSSPSPPASCEHNSVQAILSPYIEATRKHLDM